jgi:WD40 repeat protein
MNEHTGILSSTNFEFSTTNEITEVNKLTRSKFLKFDGNLLNIEICNQGINWSSLNTSRESLRKNRLIHHKGFRNCIQTNEEKKQIYEFLKSTKRDIFYQFKEMLTNIPISIAHFQLRKNLKILDDHELIYIRTFGIEKMNIITGKRDFLVLFEGDELEDSSKAINFDICLKNGDLNIVCGKINSQIIFYTIKEYMHMYNRLNKLNSSNAASKVMKNTRSLQFFRMRVSESNESQITNHVEFIENGTKLLICSNDTIVKIYDIESGMKLERTYKCKGPINNVTLNYSKQELAMVGDFETVEIYDYKTSDLLFSLKGHTDFGFSCKFQPLSNYILATGNQDYSCKIWDLRKVSGTHDDSTSNEISQSLLKSLYGHFEAIGEFLFINQSLIAYAENADFLHLYDMNSNTLQTFEYFGSSAGLCKQSSTNKLYLSIREGEANSGFLSYDPIRDRQFSLESLVI